MALFYAEYKMIKKLKCGLDLSDPQIMGILNATPDSFSDGGRNQQQALAHALDMIKQGASIIDIGGESTRPGASIVSVQEEIDRVIPLVEVLSKYDILISIDTSQPDVISSAVKAGAHIWNDVRALTRPNALETAAALDIPIVLMHMRGEPSTMNQLATYQNVVNEVLLELKQKIEVALQHGILKENIIIDPGFGFAKNTKHNINVLKNFSELQQLGYPILSGLSRKRFIGEITQVDQANERLVGSVTGHLLCVQQGANIVRTHDVQATKEALEMWKAIR